MPHEQEPKEIVIVEVAITSDQPNHNLDAFAVGQLSSHAHEGKPLPRVQHLDIDPKSWAKLLAAKQYIAGTVLSCRWYCPECHAELPGPHEASCATERLGTTPK